LLGLLLIYSPFPEPFIKIADDFLHSLRKILLSLLSSSATFTLWAGQSHYISIVVAHPQ
jgi:hypothetical protein